MITDKDIANVCAASYDPATKWQRLWAGGTDSNGIYAGLAGDVLCFRGSVTIEDWIDDLDAIATIDSRLGGLHAGFAKGVYQFFTSLNSLINNNTVVCGHSLGASRALLFGAYMQQAGIKPKAIITFGSPRPGFQKLADILAPVTIRSYKNRLDPVTSVPFPVPPDLPYIHPRYLTLISVPPPIDNFLDPLADHSINLYAQGVPATVIS